MRAVGYVRVSTLEQARDGVSLDAQKSKIEGYCKVYGIELVEVVEDAGISAKTLDRPGVARVLSMLKTGVVDGLVIAKLDRLTRSVRDWGTLIDDHFGDRQGKHLISIADSINTTTASGRLVLNVLMSIAQWEREIIQERTQEALDFKRSQREVVRHVPFGLKLGEDGIHLEIDSVDEAARDEAMRLRSEGLSYRVIARELTGLFPTKQGGIGKAWSPSTVHKILRPDAAHESAPPPKSRPPRPQ